METGITIRQILVDAEVCVSFAQVRRLVHEGAVKVDGAKAKSDAEKVVSGQQIKVGRLKEFRVN